VINTQGFQIILFTFVYLRFSLKFSIIKKIAKQNNKGNREVGYLWGIASRHMESISEGLMFGSEDAICFEEALIPQLLTGPV
jgi:hypothetical protein